VQEEEDLEEELEEGEDGQDEEAHHVVSPRVCRIPVCLHPKPRTPHPTPEAKPDTTTLRNASDTMRRVDCWQVGWPIACYWQAGWLFVLFYL
jgi:hypothetical protein